MAESLSIRPGQEAGSDGILDHLLRGRFDQHPVSCIETAKVSRISRGPSTEQQLQAAKSLVRREVLRQVIAPLRVISARMMLY